MKTGKFWNTFQNENAENVVLMENQTDQWERIEYRNKYGDLLRDGSDISNQFGKESIYEGT